MMRGRPWAALIVCAGLCGCEATLPPEARPKPFSLAYAKEALITQKPTWILTNAQTVRNARIGKFDKNLIGNFSVCVAYDWRDRTGAYTGIKPYIVFIGPDHSTIVQVTPPDGSHPCNPDELAPFPELNGAK